MGADTHVKYWRPHVTVSNKASKGKGSQRPAHIRHQSINGYENPDSNKP